MDSGIPIHDSGGAKSRCVAFACIRAERSTFPGHGKFDLITLTKAGA
jgi:hypothetical protein